MKYSNVHSGKFISRPNRFIAHVEINKKTEICHVKNTGRCAELLIPGTKVFVQKSDNPNRKTKYDLISVEKNGEIVNIDSQSPNKIFHEWVLQSGFFKNIKTLLPEQKYKNSRFDFYIETDTEKSFIETKGVTLEYNGLCAFPDAPTERGVKHLKELCSATEDGYGAYLFFIIQLKNAHTLVPNRNTHPAFADALCEAKNKGVRIFALTCDVESDSIYAKKFIDVSTEGGGYFG